MTEFEKKLKFLCSAFQYVDSSSADVINGVIQDYAKDLLDLAMKELQPEFDKEMDKMLAETDKVVYQKGHKDALKSLPKWKKSTLPIPDEEYPTGFNGKYFCYKGYCIDYKKLFEILPKEE